MKNKRVKPGKIATVILRIMLPKEEAEFLLGDYQEEFHHIFETKGRCQARLSYWKLVLESIPGLIINQIS